MIFSFQGAAKELLSLHVSVYGNYQLLTITGLKRIFNIIMQTKNDHPHITVRAIVPTPIKSSFDFQLY